MGCRSLSLLNRPVLRYIRASRSYPVLISLGRCAVLKSLSGGAEQIRGWGESDRQRLFQAISRRVDSSVSRNLSARVRGVRRIVDVSSAHYGVESKSSAINLILDTSEWLPDVYFECILSTAGESEFAPTDEVGHLRITCSGSGPKNLIPCLQARVKIQDSQMSDIGGILSSLNCDTFEANVHLLLDGLNYENFEEFSEKLNIYSNVIGCKIFEFSMKSRLGDVGVSKRMKKFLIHSNDEDFQLGY